MNTFVSLLVYGLADGAILALAALGFVPVSYTHLDVYKRQVLLGWASVGATSSPSSATTGPSG